MDNSTPELKYAGRSTSDLKAVTTAADKVVVRLIRGFVPALSVTLMLLGACSSGSPASEAERALGATDTLSAADETILGGLGVHPRAWNRAAGPFIRDYLDPNVIAEQWVAAASHQVDAMRQAHIGLQKDIMLLGDPGVRSVLTEFVDNYRAKLDAVTLLHIAVANEDQEAEANALSGLREAADDGKNMATELIDDLRPFMSEDDLRALLAE